VADGAQSPDCDHDPRRPFKLSWRHRDKEWGVVDCASIVIIERVGSRTVFGYDRHFVEPSRQRGFTVL